MSSYEHLLHNITAPNDRSEMYQELTQALNLMISEHDNPISSLCNAVATIHTALRPLWTGIYRVKGEELVLYPFQGPAACVSIPYGKGVCGLAWAKGETIVVPNVNEFSGHIACSSLSQSEIVVPIIHNNSVLGVIDIDSETLNAFGPNDKLGLEACAMVLAQKVNWEKI